MHIDWRKLCLVCVLILCVGTTAGVAPAWAQSPDPSKLVLAFYYTWYDENTWIPEKVIDMPLEPYASRDRAVMARHIEQAKSAGIDALVASWYGPQVENNQTEPNFSALLELAQEREFKVAADYETASPFINSQAETIAALRHLLDVHAPKDAYLKVDGRPVIFFWAIDRVPLAEGQTSALAAWRAIRQQVDPEHRSIWIAEGVDIAYQEVFDGHHLYNIAWAADVGRSLADWQGRVRKWSASNGQDRLWVATVMPGWNDLKTGRSSAYVRDRENGGFYRACWEGAIATQPDWIIITSFNEWIENSYIEPGQAYGNVYLDLTREWSDRFKASILAAGAAETPTMEAPVTEEAASEAAAVSLAASPTAHSTTEAAQAPSGADPAAQPLVTVSPVVVTTTRETTAVALAASPVADSTEESAAEATDVSVGADAGADSPVAANLPLSGTAVLSTAPVFTPTLALVASLTLSGTGEIDPTPIEMTVVVSGEQTEQHLGVLELSPSAGVTVTGEILDGKTPLRDGPGKEYAVIGLLHEGFIVQIVEGDPAAEWLQVVAPTGEIGYVQAESVDWQQIPVPQSPSQFVTSPSVSQIDGAQGTGMGRIATVISGTKLRGGPSTSFGPVTKLEEGDQLAIIGSNLDGSWYQANLADGSSGWVLAYKVVLLEPTATPAPLVTAPLTPTVAATETFSATVPLTTALPVTSGLPALVTAEPSPVPAATPLTGLAAVLSEGAPHRTEALFGIVLVIAGIGVLLVALASAVLHFSARRGT